MCESSFYQHSSVRKRADLSLWDIVENEVISPIASPTCTPFLMYQEDAGGRI
jgi:hypothetical protein